MSEPFSLTQNEGEALEECLIRVASRVLSDAVGGWGSESVPLARSGDLTFSKSNVCLARMFSMLETPKHRILPGAHKRHC